MEKHFHYNSIRKTIIQFLDMFNNMKVAKYDEDGNVLSYIKVPVKLSTKQKFYYWLNDRKDITRLPMIGAFIDSIEPSTSMRGNNKGINFSSNNGIMDNFKPYTINFRLTLATLYMNQADQLLEQILPYFDPYTMIRVQIPEVNSHFDAKCILNGVSPENDADMDDDTIRKYKWDLDFTVHSFVVKPLAESKEIHDIYLNMKNYDLISNPALSGDGNFETLHISGYKDNSSSIITNYEILGVN